MTSLALNHIPNPKDFPSLRHYKWQQPTTKGWVQSSRAQSTIANPPLANGLNLESENLMVRTMGRTRHSWQTSEPADSPLYKASHRRLEGTHYSLHFYSLHPSQLSHLWLGCWSSFPSEISSFHVRYPRFHEESLSRRLDYPVFIGISEVP